jgi:hypothetical protein
MKCNLNIFLNGCGGCSVSSSGFGSSGVGSGGRDIGFARYIRNKELYKYSMSEIKTNSKIFIRDNIEFMDLRNLTISNIGILTYTLNIFNVTENININDSYICVSGNGGADRGISFINNQNYYLTKSIIHSRNNDFISVEIGVDCCESEEQILFIEDCIFDNIRIAFNNKKYFAIIKNNIFYGHLPPDRYKYVIDICRGECDDSDDSTDSTDSSGKSDEKGVICGNITGNIVAFLAGKCDENKKKYFGDGINPLLKSCYSSPTAAL